MSQRGSCVLVVVTGRSGARDLRVTPWTPGKERPFGLVGDRLPPVGFFLRVGVDFPVEPGFAKVRIKPQVGTLTSGSLDLPTVRGTIHVDFTSAKDESFDLNVHLPANVSATVYLPALGSRTPAVQMDGESVAGTLRGPFIALDPIPSGRHHFHTRR